jgi:hypothetical protein
MIQVIDIRKHDPEKVVDYWKSKGGNDININRWYLLFPNKDTHPYVGIDINGQIEAWGNVNEKHLIDLPEKTNWVDEFLEGTNTDAEITGGIKIEHKGIKAFAEYDLDRVKFDVSCQKEDFQNIEQIVKIIAEKFNLKC